LALVTVLQMVENLTDRQAADAVRDKISWKYALGLGLDEEGFDPSVLCEFRTRVVAHGLEQRVLDLLLDALKTEGLVGAGRQGAHRLHPGDRRGARCEPAGAGRGERARRPGGDRGGRP
jgi:IS5 family transposase